MVEAENQDEPKRRINVRVKNDNAEDFEDMFEGRRYVFKALSTVSIPLHAAKGIFGYDIKDCDEQQMFLHTCRRWGWNSPENVKNHFDHIKQLWANFEFTPVAVKMVEMPTIDTSALADAKEGAKTPPEVPNLKLGDPSIRAKSAAA